MRVGFLITARLKSSRLPKKLLLPFGNETYIVQLIKRLKTSPFLDEIIICTSVDDQDTDLEIIAQDQGIKCYRGDREDVISRLNEARIKYNLDYVINMTADCPLLPIEHIPNLINQFKETKADLIHLFDMPIGLYLSGLNPEAMQKIVNLKNDGLTEYWLYYFLKTTIFKVEHLSKKYTGEILKRDYRLGIDYPEDHTFFTALYNAYGENLFYATSNEIIKFLDNHPEIAAINVHCNELGKIRTENDPSSKISLKNVN
ncbi:MAG: NTP transferase domain-containing protein [Flavobacterium sp.]|nr:NTP transferase domain-containing protein [Flavobacterium sp.]